MQDFNSANSTFATFVKLYSRCYKHICAFETKSKDEEKICNNLEKCLLHN